MSALDDVLEYHLDKANVAALTHKTDQAERLSATNAAAREELELLREAADLGWKYCAKCLGEDCAHCGWSKWTHKDHPRSCAIDRILRTDPERARAMGLGWAI